MKQSIYAVLALVLLFIGASLLIAATTVQDLHIKDYVLVSTTRIGPYHWHLSYTAKLTNNGVTDIPGATAKLRSFLDILIVDGQLSFGPVAAGQTVTSMDTFTLRWPIGQSIDSRLLERYLRWDIALTNAVPIADAGPDQTVLRGSTVMLDGSGSSDVDGDPLTYHWAFTAKPSGSSAALTGADTATPTFVVDLPGNYDIVLIVNDGQSDSTPDSVKISTQNSAPVADAGSDQSVFTGDTVMLDGTASSDVDGDPLSYYWSFTAKPTGSQAVLSDPIALQPSFTVDKPGDYVVQLIVNDGQSDSTPDSVKISTQNSAPVANAGPDQSVFIGDTVMLDGSKSSDADGDALTYRWSLLSQPTDSAAVLTDDQTVNPSFTVDKLGSYMVQLIVNDGMADSPPDSIVVSTQNSRPVADAGDNQTAIVGDTVTLDGSGSHDADGDSLSFSWSLISQPTNSTTVLIDDDKAIATLIPDQAGDYIAQLIVDDGQLESDPDTALVTVSVPPPSPNQNPQITSSAVTTGQSGSPYSYQVTATDPDGDLLSYALTTAPAGMTISVSGLIDWLPTGVGNFDVSIEVTDGKGGSATQSFTIDVSAALITVPDVVGLAEAQAIADITNAGLTVGANTQANSDTVPAGNIISQDPAAGAQVAAGSPVDIVVSVGPATEPPVPPSTVAVDPNVQPEVTQISGFDGEPDRPVTALTDKSGILMHFVENELIVVSNDMAAVSALAARWGGTVMRSFVPSDFGLSGTAQYLVRIDPNTVDPSQLMSDLQQLEPAVRNDLRVSNQAGLQMIAAAAREAATGNMVGLNIVLTPDGFVDRTTTENASLGICPTQPTPNVPPGADGCVWPGIAGSESFSSDAYTWSYMRAGGVQNIGVGEAWRSLSLAGLLGNAVTLAVIDGGFSNLAIDNPAETGYLNAANALEPNVYPANTVPCSNGAACPWHGANVVSAAMGPADDSKGAAGPAGPIAKAMTIRRNTDVFGTGLAFAAAFASPARIINMSFGERVPATLSWSVEPFNALTAAVHAGGKLLIASAGNDNADVDSEDCVPVIGSPCWEDSWWTPCENDGVFCVGALAGNSTSRAGYSNWGNKDVDLFGPGTVWVGGDPFDPEPHAANGTSFAAPFVAGVAALVMAANPALDNTAVEQALIQTAWPSGDANVQRYVNAQGAVNLALGGSSVCTAPQILTLTPDHSTAPCLQNDFEVTHSQAFGPFQYQWRKLVEGTTDRVNLADGDNISGSTTDHMTINPFRPADEGRYDVVVSNLCGATTSGLITVSLVDGTAQLAPSLPEPRGEHAMAFDRGRGRMVLYGGYTPVQYGNSTLLKYSNETWERDGSGAWQVVTNQGPGRRIGAAMAYDEARGVTVLFGGFLCEQNQFCPWGNPGGPVYYTDTWEWDGATWTQKPVAAPPPYFRWHSMTYDSIRQRVVMYGGQDPLGRIGTTPYEWDGVAWTSRGTSGDPVYGYPPAILPSPFTFDRDRNVYVLYRVFDTWELDSVGQWARRAAQINAMGTTSLPAGMSFDSDRGRTLLYNVVNPTPTTVEGALWEWTGTTWQRKLMLPLPAADAPTLVYDSGRKRTALAGTGRGFLVSSAVWEWRYFADDPSCSLGPP